MASESHGTNVARTYVGQALKRYYAESIFQDITHREYKAPGGGMEASIKSAGQQFQILDIQGGALQSYNGSDLTSTEPTESKSLLTIDQTRAVHEIIKDLNVFKSQVKDPKSSVVEQLKNNLKNFTEGYVLGHATSAAAGHWVGTDYVTGTVAIDAAGAVTGTGTVFVAGMVGKPFRAAGHTKWYRVATRGSNTAITIVQDLDDEDNTYDGGVIGAGATYTIQADTKLTIDNANIFNVMVSLGILLDKAEVPTSDRYIVFPHEAKSAIMASAKINNTLIQVTDANVVKGMLYKEMISGFKVYCNNNLTGDNTSGYNVVVGQKSFIGAGFGMISPLEQIRSQQNFGDIVKTLFGCGAAVADGRKKFGAHLFATFQA